MTDKTRFLAAAAVFVTMLLVGACGNNGDNGTGPDNGGPEPVDASDLLGTWYLEDMTSELHLTTSTDQTAKDFLNPGEGAITFVSADSGPSAIYWPWIR